MRRNIINRTLISGLLTLAMGLQATAQESGYPPGTILFDCPEQPAPLTAPSYRIPALAVCADQSLLAVADYRLRLSDIGTTSGTKVSQIELRFRRSNDCGATWTEEQTIRERNQTDKNDWRYAMGDAALVADRESGDVLVMCAAGTVSWGNSTARRPIKVAAFRSNDNGQTWDEGQEITEQIYGLYGGDATAIFITSGSLCQSTQIKVGSHYRIYAAHPIRTASRGNSTSVIYSDDFGQTWHILGPANEFPKGTVLEEGKVAELWDGSVVLMVRDDYGAQDVNKGKKNFNRFVYTNVETGEGEWSEAASGITGMANACNSTLLVVPARRADNGLLVQLALVALPFHTTNIRDRENNYGRKNVGFYFKELATEADYATGEALAEGWQRGLQVTDQLSAYTDLALLPDGNIGLLAEDNGTQGAGVDGNKETEAYDIVFRSLPISLITQGAYEALTIEKPSGITQTIKENTTTAAYDLQGRLVGNTPSGGSSSPTGIFIKGNQKFLQ